MRVQIIGARGMLGRAVVQAAALRGIDVWDQPLDLEVATHAHIRGEVVINCAGLVKQRQASASRFMLVNAYGPHHLAEAAEQVGARVIHVSTDCVFQRPGPHCECSTPDADDVYSRSKRAGELLAAPHLTIRTSFVGAGDRGLVTTIVEGRLRSASTKQLWSGHTVETIAGVLLDLAARPDVTGLLHVPGDEQTRYDLANALCRALGVAPSFVRDDEYRADRRLISDRWAALGLPDLPSFTEQLRGAPWIK